MKYRLNSVSFKNDIQASIDGTKYKIRPCDMKSKWYEGQSNSSLEAFVTEHNRDVEICRIKI